MHKELYSIISIPRTPKGFGVPRIWNRSYDKDEISGELSKLIRDRRLSGNCLYVSYVNKEKPIEDDKPYLKEISSHRYSLAPDNIIILHFGDDGVNEDFAITFFVTKRKVFL